MKLWSFSLWKQEFEKSVALERTVTMADECARTLKSNNPPSIVLNHYIKYDTLVSSELLLVVNATSISIDNVIEV
jgi:shikimate 5-dehydrogenase